MKPFRGKPEKPERSNGEIQRVSSAPERWTLETVGGPRGPQIAPFSLKRVGVTSACTSPLVGRRDPSGAGLRYISGWRPSGAFGLFPFGPPITRPARPTVSLVARGREPLIRVRPVASACGVFFFWWASGDSCLDSTGPVRLLATVSSDRLRSYARRRRLSFGYFQDPS